MKQPKISPSLPHFLISTAWRGLVFRENWFAILLNRTFMSDLIHHSIPSGSVVINPVISSLVYLVPFASEFFTV